MSQTKSHSPRSRMKSFAYAFSGLRMLTASEPNFKIHIVIACVACSLAWVMDFTTMEWFVVILTIGMVLAMEAVNTAVEKLADVVSPHYDERIKVVKDVMAAAVLITAIVACVVGCFLFIPKFI
jgi:diacylglycerol kinase (ATP)